MTWLTFNQSPWILSGPYFLASGNYFFFRANHPKRYVILKDKQKYFNTKY